MSRQGTELPHGGCAVCGGHFTQCRVQASGERDCGIDVRRTGASNGADAGRQSGGGR